MTREEQAYAQVLNEFGSDITSNWEQTETLRVLHDRAEASHEAKELVLR